MKKNKITSGIAMAFLALGITSCTISQTAVVTNNAVGSKVGKAKGTIFSPSLDITYKKAKENGGITKVGIAEVKVTNYLIIPFFQTTVTGE